MPTGRPTVLALLLAASLAASPILGVASALAAPSVDVDPDAPDPNMDLDESEASPPSITDAIPPAASSQSDQAYDDRVRSAFVAAQNLKGPLEGAWSVQDAQGRTALKLELNDDRASGEVSGAWFDPNTVGDKAGSGLIDDVIRQNGGFIAHLLAQGSLDLTTLQFQQSASGAWSGTLLQGPRSEPVTMVRDPASLGASAIASGSAQPYNPAAAAKAPAKKVVRKAPAKKPAAKKPAAKAPAKKK